MELQNVSTVDTINYAVILVLFNVITLLSIYDVDIQIAKYEILSLNRVL